MTDLPSIEDLKAWEALIASRLAASAEQNGDEKARLDAICCIRNVISIERDCTVRARGYGLVGLAEDIVRATSHITDLEAFEEVFELLMTIDETIATDTKIEHYGVALRAASLAKWADFAGPYVAVCVEANHKPSFTTELFTMPGHPVVITSQA